MTLPAVDPVAAAPKPGRLVLGVDVFTSGQIARRLGVAPRTVSKWFDSGKLRGYRIPGGDGRGSDRRIPVEELRKFVEEHGLPGNIPEAASEDRHVTVLFGDGAADPVSPVRLGVLLSGRKVAGVTVGPADGLAAAVALAREVRAIDPTVRLTLQLGEDRGPEDVPAGVFDEVRS